MSSAASRLMLRHTKSVTRPGTFRFASSTSEAAQAVSSTATKTKEAVSSIASKASQGLGRVQSSTGPVLSGTVQRINGFLGNIGGRTGRLIRLGTSLIPPTIYYSKVSFELSKLVFRGRKMNPPSQEAFKLYFDSIFRIVKHPGAFFFGGASENTTLITARDVLSRIRNVNREQLISSGIIFAEVLGFFSIGEIIGKRKIVGYRGDVEHGEHH